MGVPSLECSNGCKKRRDRGLPWPGECQVSKAQSNTCCLKNQALTPFAQFMLAPRLARAIAQEEAARAGAEEQARREYKLNTPAYGIGWD